MAEIGVILLMFGVGMHFHPGELLRVWRIAVPGAIGQSAVAALAGWGAARAFGWSHAAGIVLGMALAVASTVVLMRMLVEQGRLSTRDGHVAVGWLIVEDLFTVAALVMLPALALERADPAATADMMPFRDVFSALFFVSVGMLFDLGFVVSQPLMVLAAASIVLVAKPAVALAIVMALRDTRRTALTVAVGLA